MTNRLRVLWRWVRMEEHLRAKWERANAHWYRNWLNEIT